MGEPLRLPPRIKVLEALGAVADKRIEVVDEHRASVVSSEGDRTYSVYIDLEKRTVDSTDNGTVYRGYIGYPIISFLIVKGVVPYNERLAEGLRGVRWRELNERYKSYQIVERIVKEHLARTGIEPREVDEYIETVMNSLRRLGLQREKRL